MRWLATPIFFAIAAGLAYIVAITATPSAAFVPAGLRRWPGGHSSTSQPTAFSDHEPGF